MDVGQIFRVNRLFLEQSVHVAHRAGQVLAAVEEADRLRQGLDPEHRHAFDHRGLGGALQRHHHAVRPRFQSPDRHRQGAGNGLDAAIERQLAHHLIAGQHPGLDVPRRLQHPQGDRQIEGGARLAQVRRGQIHGDAPQREGEAAVGHGRLDAVAALAHRGVGQPHGGEYRQAVGQVDLHLNAMGVNTQQGAAEHLGQDHDSSTRAGLYRNQNGRCSIP